MSTTTPGTKSSLRALAEKCNHIVTSVLFPEGQDTFCKLHDTSLYGTDKNAHNCIGCNLNNYAYVFRSAIAPKEHYWDEFDLFANIILHAYVLMERINVFTKLLGIKAEDFVTKYPNLQKTRKYANFIKHPKAFMLVHDPRYFFKGSTTPKADIIIDYEFIKKYYSTENSNNELYQKLTKATKVVVELPDLEELTAGICSEFDGFVNELIGNKKYRDILTNHTTVESFFSSDNVDGENQN